MAIATGQQGTNLGPLTTAWEAPSHCYIPVVGDLTNSWAWQGQRCSTFNDDEGIETTAVYDDVDCWPPNDAEQPEPPLLGWGFYSPGLVCPANYIAACTAAYGDRAEWPVQFSLIEDEKAIGCCPEGYQCTNQDGNLCVSVVSQSTGVLGGSCVDESIVTGDYDSPNTVLLTLSSESQIITRVSIQTLTLHAPLFQLIYKDSDIATRTVTEEAETAISSSATSNGADSAGDDAASGMSMREKIMIGVGVGAGVSALVALSAFVFWKRRRSRKSDRVSGAGQVVLGMGETPKPVEIGGDTRPVELSAVRLDD